MTHPQRRELVAATFNDAGLWKKLLEEAQEGASKKPLKPNFFVVEIVEGNLHTAGFPKLDLPKVFLTHYCESLSETITLEGPDGQKWQAMLGQAWKQKISGILDGWRQFAVDYNLELSDQVVFFLLKDSHFLVQVFDVNNNVKGKGIPMADRGDSMGADFGAKPMASRQQKQKIAEMGAVQVQAHTRGESSRGVVKRYLPLNSGKQTLKLEGGIEVGANLQNDIKGKGILVFPDREDRMDRDFGTWMGWQATSHQQTEKSAEMGMQLIDQAQREGGLSPDTATVNLERGIAVDANRAHRSTIGDEEIDSTEEDESVPLRQVNWDRASKKPTATGSPIRKSCIKQRQKILAPRSNYAGPQETLVLHNRPNNQLGTRKRQPATPLDRPPSSKTRLVVDLFATAPSGTCPYLMLD